MIVAVEAGGATLLYISMDGLNFAHAVFPENAQDKYGYTILESSPSSITVDTLSATSRNKIPVYGSIYFSNSNGTFFKVGVSLLLASLDSKTSIETYSVK